MHEISTHMIKIQTTEIAMKPLSFLKRNLAMCTPFVNICVNRSVLAWSGPVQVCLCTVMAS